MNRFRVMCVAAFRSFIFFTETDYVSICTVTYVPFSMYIYVLVSMCMRRMVGHETTPGTINFTLSRPPQLPDVQVCVPSPPSQVTSKSNVLLIRYALL
jgi:hypothetical protein